MSLMRDPDIHVLLDTNVWLTAIKLDLLDDVLRLGEHPRIQWRMPWEPGLSKEFQIMVKELREARDKEARPIAAPPDINRILRQIGTAGQILVNQPETSRYAELYEAHAKRSASPLRFADQMYRPHQPHAGEVLCLVCAERESLLFCSQDDDARRFAAEYIPRERVMSMAPMFQHIEDHGIDLPGKLHSPSKRNKTLSSR